MASVNIHPTALVAEGAELDEGVVVGPYSVIGKHVKVGKNTIIHSHALLQGHTILGEENQIFSFSSVGNPPQDLKYKGEKTLLEIGNKNTIREYVTMQPGTIQGGGKTVIGNENLFMAYVHVAHDCIIGSQNVLANGVQLAGHVTIQNMAILGGLAAVHQFVVVGNMSMLSGGTMLKQDLPPYCIADGFRSSLRGLNIVALQRRNVSPEARTAIKNMYKIIFLDNHPTVETAISQIPQEDLNHSEIQNFISFIRNSKRGVTRPQSSLKNGELSDE
ncbi:MAG: acyl-ACP--UDP-N-acetylglucosamine O-acyltransferase [Bdellovibrionota bacterium]